MRLSTRRFNLISGAVERANSGVDMSWVEDNLLTRGDTILYQVGYMGGAEAVLTSHRVIFVNRVLAERDIQDLSLVNVVNVVARQGMFQDLFNRGTVIVGSSNGSRDMEIPNVPNPWGSGVRLWLPLRPCRTNRASSRL